MEPAHVNAEFLAHNFIHLDSTEQEFASSCNAGYVDLMYSREKQFLYCPVKSGAVRALM